MVNEDDWKNISQTNMKKSLLEKFCKNPFVKKKTSEKPKCYSTLNETLKLQMTI